MELTLYPISLVILVGAAVGLTLSLTLCLIPWGNRVANRCLSALLIANVLFSITYVFHAERALPLAMQSIFSLQMVIGPLLYFFTRMLTEVDFRWQRQHVWHFLPALIFSAVWQLQLPLSPGATLNLPCFKAEDCDLLYHSRFIHRAATYLSLVAYGLAALGVLRPHLQRIKASYSTIEDVSLRWLKILASAYLLGVAVGVAIELGGLRSHVAGNVQPGLVLALWPLLLTLLMGWFGLLQRRIQLGAEAPNPRSGDTAAEAACREPDPGKKYQTSSLTEQGAKEIWRRLQQMMANEKPFLQPGLKIADLAEMLDVPVHHLSETVNGFAKQSFYDFINQYRVEEAAQLLADTSRRHLSVTDICLEAGFNSQSTFFTHFKKRLKLTPRQFRQQRLPQQPEFDGSNS